MTKRLQNLARLVAEFKTRNLTRSDVEWLLNLSSSCGKAYLRDLAAARIIEVVGRVKRQGAVGGYWADEYGITAPPAIVAAYLATLNDGTAPNRSGYVPSSPKGKRKEKPVEYRAPMRFVVRRDPLVAALFGEARCQPYLATTRHSVPRRTTRRHTSRARHAHVAANSVTQAQARRISAPTPAAVNGCALTASRGGIDGLSEFSGRQSSLSGFQ